MYSVEFDSGSSRSLYVQIYDYLKKELADGRIVQGERLPSIRNMAKMLGVSVTTVRMAYDQLIVEGYLESRPQSGYYAIQGSWDGTGHGIREDSAYTHPVTVAQAEEHQNDMMYDPESFDFVKWKKCMASVLNDTPELLLSEGDRQGEPALRTEIAAYLYKSRGVVCGPEQVVISAGTQQLVTHIARILKVMGITLVCKEDPGYEPASRIFGDRGFAISSIPVRSDGIEIEKLPANIRSAVYVSPQNQFPTGALMPIGRRHRLLEWADDNDSIIIEDDYDSELRYFGKPIPPLASLDKAGRVVYFGSFSSTLFPAIKISYIILPKAMAKIFSRIKRDYDQTCSKEEQLALAMFMEKGYYYTNIKKLRSLCAQKLQAALTALSEYATGFVTPMNTHSGINLTLRVQTYIAPDELCRRAAELGLYLVPVASLTDQTTAELIFYYNRVPIGDIGPCVKAMIDAWR